MSLCVDARMLSSSGIGTFLKNMIPLLSSRIARLIVHPDDPAYYPWLTSYPLVFCSAPIYSVREQFEIPSLVPKECLFWSPHYNVPLLPLRAKHRIVTIHDVAHLHFKHSLSWQERLYASFMLKQALTRSDLIFSDSAFSQEEIAHYFPLHKERIHVVHNGINVERFSSCQKEALFAQKYNLPPAFFLFVGNLKPHKNLKLILDVYTKYSVPIPTVVIGKIHHLINPDPLIPRIQENAFLRENIRLIGSVPDEDVPLFYRHAQALIFPSLYEGFGLPPLEAMASKCPVIASSMASLPEVCGEAALFIDATCARSLYEAMLRLLNDTAFRMSLVRSGEERVHKFSWENTANNYLRLIDQLS